jgi:hypothetical protein
MNPCRAKLSRTRTSKSGSRGRRCARGVTTEDYASYRASSVSILAADSRSPVRSSASAASASCAFNKDNAFNRDTALPSVT